MLLTEPLVLPVGTTLLPVGELSEELRREIGSKEGDFALSRRNSRQHSKVFNAETAALIRQFEGPSTIAQAVARFSRGKSVNPEQLLEEALPMLQMLIGQQLLVAADSIDAAEHQPALAGEKEVHGWEIIRCVQSLQDTEVYQVRNSEGTLGALKLGEAVLREAFLLSKLDASVTPKLLDLGDWNGRPYFVGEWFDGVDSVTACAEFRQRNDFHSVRAITARILDAYASLHEQNVVHGDIHPGNILINRAGQPKIIDLGLSDEPSRGGVSFFFEPELANAILSNSPAPVATTLGEQYGIAALLYLLLTGMHYLEFSLEKNKMFSQIAENPMRPFEKPWPAIEAVLQKALSKKPSDRFASTREFADTFRSAEIPKSEIKTPAYRVRPNLTKILRGVTLASPTTSINYGSAGIAYALYQIACSENDGELLAQADIWSAKSLRELGNEGAFYDGINLTRETVGESSLYHSPAGIYVVQALIANARGDSETQHWATDSFIRFSKQDCLLLDLTLGLAGLLLGNVFLLDATTTRNEKLLANGRALHRRLWEGLKGRELTNLAIAHGWAGILYSSLCWSAASGDPVSDLLLERLDWLVRQSRVMPATPGWCNGSAGFVFLWSVAHEVLGNPGYLDLAESAAWNAWQARAAIGNLCCGIAGHAYAFLNIYRQNGDVLWLQRARDAAALASATKTDGIPPLELRAESLYKGDIGLAVLEADLNHASDSRMPLFERAIVR